MSRVSKSHVLSRCRKQAKGFSLVEVLVVVLIILVIAAISLPHFNRARMMANEASAVASIRAVQDAEAMYSSTYPQIGFAGRLSDLGSHGTDCKSPSKTNACLITDDLLVSGLKSGYTFDLVGDGNIPDHSYTLTATPISADATGRCAFVGDQTGQIQTLTSNKSGHFAASGGGCGS